MVPLTTTIVFAFLLILGQASDTSERGEDCSSFDRCKAGDFFRTCSCDRDCYKYGTCCSDSDQYAKMASEQQQYWCHSDRTSMPVYAKRACAVEFSGGEVQTRICTQGVRDKADVLNNLLVTSTKSKTTYWNRNCAICNKENRKDLRLWAVQVVCPSKHGDVTFRKSYVEDHLTFDLDLEEWGLKVKDGFVACTLTFLQPTKTVGKLNYCAPNLVSSCPAGFEDSEVVEKCSTYHAERKQKNTDLYFRNVHCALCNGVSEDDLECVGRNYSPLNNIKGKDVVKVVFDSGVWLDRNETEKYKCSSGNMYDPFQARCRQMPESFLRDLNATLYPVNFAPRIMGDAYVFAILLVFILISKYSFYC
ncbi:uncharacterized protein CDAR_442381 [Caerostris darwini]|uniref:SMB domain-containing protein n=1 Tax=Caerostris darwini TaxID=1538125 RepID=A0AAV4V020_9ARAC|nr:uncharacterized protein CDAR_442381 [Caerostris darwini]